MSRLVDIDKIPKTTLAYIAGFFDGEGSITIHRNRKNAPNYTMQCGVWQMDKNPLDYIAFYFGGNVYKKYKDLNRKGNMWVWAATTRNALVFLKAIEPYLIVKKAQAKLAIEFQHSMVTRRAGFHRVSDYEIALREADKILMQNLKRQCKSKELIPLKTQGIKHMAIQGELL